MNRPISIFLQLVVGMIGITLSLWLLKNLYGFVFLGNEHPIDILLRFFNARPVMFQTFTNISLFKVIPLMVSAITAITIYVSLTGIIALGTCIFLGERRR